MEERIAKLESSYAKIYAKHDALMLAFSALLLGELSIEHLDKLKERQIANALSTSAPDAAIDGFEEEFSHLSSVLATMRTPL